MPLKNLLECLQGLGLLISWKCKPGRMRGAEGKWGIISLQGEGGWLGWELACRCRWMVMAGRVEG